MSKNHNIFDNAFQQIITFDNFKNAFNKTEQSNTRQSSGLIKFSMDLTYNINQLRNKIIEKNYSPDQYKVFDISEPKERIIAAPQYKDKLVQFAVHRILNPAFERKFIYDSYSCIKNKGTHKAAKRAQHFLRKAKWKWGSPWIVKADIKSYFYSIDHNILKHILRREIKCNDTNWLLGKIIDGSPENPGLPLGNITSQLFANLYLNELDKYMKRKLSKEFYLRYMDDFTCIVKTRSEAKNIKTKIKKFVNENLSLKLNKKKSKIFPLAQGLNFTGYKIWATHMLLRKKSKERVKSKLKKFPKLIKKGELTKQKAHQMLNSWKGHADHACSENLYKYLVNRFDFLFRENGKFKINMSKIKE